MGKIAKEGITMKNFLKIAVLGVFCCYASWAAQAASWSIPFFGEVRLADSVSVLEGTPKSIMTTGPKGMESEMQRHGLYGGKYYVLVDQHESNFRYAMAGIVPLDGIWRQRTLPDKGWIPLPKPIVQPKPVPMGVTKSGTKMMAGKSREALSDRRMGQAKEQQVRARFIPLPPPKDAKERLAQAAAYWNKEWRDGQAEPIFTLDAKSKKNYQGRWSRLKREKDIVFREIYRGWLVDDGRHSYLFFIATDDRNAAWLDELSQAVDKRGKWKAGSFSFSRR